MAFTTVVCSFFLSFGFVTPFTEEVRSRASTVSDGRDLLRLCCNKIIQSLTKMREDKYRYDEPRKDVCPRSHDCTPCNRLRLSLRLKLRLRVSLRLIFQCKQLLTLLTGSDADR